MNETMRSKLVRLLQDTGIYRIDVRFKCKTKDGMTYTLLTNEFHRKDCPGCQNATSSDDAQEKYAEWVVSVATEETLHISNIVDGTAGGGGDTLWFSIDEMMSIRHSEIVRIWAELGDIYTEGPIII